MDKRIWMVLPLSLLFLVSMFYRMSSAVIASELVRDLSLTAEALGLLSSVFFYAFALAQIPMGIAMDIFGVKRVICGLSSVGIVGGVIFAASSSFPAAFVGRALLGVGMACALMGTYKHISIWFAPRSFATLSGLTLSIGTLGNAIATAPLAVGVNLMGWRKAFLLIVCIHLIITFWIYSAVKDYPEGEEQKSTLRGHRGHSFKGLMDGLSMVFRLPSFWLIALASFVRYGTYISIAGLWAGPYLEHVYHVSLVDRGKILLAIPIGYMIASPIFGILSDRVFRSRKGVVLFALLFYTIFIFPLTGFCPVLPLGLIVAALFFIGILSSFSMIMHANIKELLPSSISGTAMSAVNFFTFAGGGFFQHLMGAMIQKFSLAQGQLPAEAFSLAFGFCFIAAALGIIAYLFVKEVRL